MFQNIFNYTTYVEIPSLSLLCDATLHTGLKKMKKHCFLPKLRSDFKHENKRHSLLNESVVITDGYDKKDGAVSPECCKKCPGSRSFEFGGRRRSSGSNNSFSWLILSGIAL